MASWLGSLASNVESLLDRVDQVANETFVKDAETLPVYFDAEGNVLPSESQLPEAVAPSQVSSSYLQTAVGSGTPYTSVQVEYDPQKAWVSRTQKSIVSTAYYLFTFISAIVDECHF
jgi:hypothetical protein